MNTKAWANKLLIISLVSFLFFGNVSVIFATDAMEMPSFMRETAGMGKIYDPSLQAGAFEYQYPLTLPPGRNGITPSLFLSYSSQNPKDQDTFGYGWDISIPYIERFNRNGLQDLYATSSARFFSSIFGELVSTSTPAEEQQGIMGMIDQLGTSESFINFNFDSGFSALNLPITIENNATNTVFTQLSNDAGSLELKTSKDNILGKKEYADGTIKYAYKTDTRVDSVNADAATVKEIKKKGLAITGEIVEKRTKGSRTFETNKEGIFVLEAVSGEPQYYKDPGGNWWLVDYATTTKESYDVQTRDSILDNIVSFFLKKVSAASETFYPDPNPESSSVDGDVYLYSYSPSTSWDTMHNASSGNAAYDAQSTVEIFVAKKTSESYSRAIERGFFYFDTSSLGSEAFVSSATLSLYTTVMTDEHNDGHDYLAVYHGNLASNNEVTFDDLDQCGSVHNPITGSDELDITNLTNNAYNNWTLNSTGLDWVDPGGVTKLCIREGHDAEDIEVSSNGTGDYVIFKSSENSGTSSDPKLIVVYSNTPQAGEMGDTYVARNDDGSYLDYHFQENYWLARDKNGKTYYFGSTSGGRQDDPDDSGKVYKWMLQKVIDANGNTITYSYSKDSGQIYPQSVIYTGKDESNGIFSVEFSKSLRATSTPTVSNTGFGVKTRYKMDTITVKVDGNTIRTYNLSYTNGDNRSRLLLSQIADIAQTENGASNISLPNTNFTYSTTSVSWLTDSNREIPQRDLIFDNHDQGISIVDVNGDNFADLVESIKGTNNTEEKLVFFNNGSNWSQTASTTWTPPCPIILYYGSPTYESDDFGGRILDLNGDMLPDFICKDKSAYINTGYNWATSTTWELPVSVLLEDGSDSGVRFADVNGDGLIDIVYSRYGDTRKVYLNNGEGWTYDGSWIVPEDLAYGESLPSRLLDINSDGLADIIKGDASVIFINTGRGWATSTEWSMPFGINDVNDTGMRFSDFNDDGLLDIGIYHTSPSVKNEVYINNGSSGWYLDPSISLTIPFQDYGQETSVRTIDVNGDGMNDLLTRGSTRLHDPPYSYHNFNQVDLNQGQRPDMLVGVNESLGKTISATYKPATLYQDGETYLNNLLPINILTLQKLEVFDGINSTSTLSYEYRGGKLYVGNSFNRKFAGFGSILRTDDDGNVTKMYYHQGDETATSSGEYDDNQSKIGEIFRTENYDNNNNLYSLSVNKWDSYNRGGDANFVELSRSTNLTYDGNIGHKDKSEEYTYDTSTGDIMQKLEWGEVSANTDGSFSDTGSDKLTTDISYVASSTGYLVLPYNQTVSDQSSNKISEKRFYYDDLSLGSVNRGNLTKQELWKSGSDYINTQKAYNSFGLVTSNTDPRSKVTTYEYDSYNLYPATTTNPLSQATAYVYDYSSGKVIKTTDPNGNIFQITLDPLDRVSEEKQSDLTIPSTLVTKASYSYNDSGMPRLVHKTSNLNSSTSTDSYVYIDGLGREIEERSRAEDSNTYAIKDYTYNKLGLLQNESLPFFSSGTSYTGTSSPATSAILTTYAYDPMQRVTTVANSVGTTTNAYDDWKLLVTDANGKIKSMYKDAYDRLWKVDEANGDDTYITTYEYNGNNNLTKITDDESNVRNFTYDGLGRRLTAGDLHVGGDETYGIWNYAYDDSGNIASTTDPKSQVVEYTYDDINRVLAENYTSGAGTEIQYGYDWCAGGIGRLCSATTTDIITKNEYNALGLIKKETKTINSTDYITQYDYDRLGNQTSIVYPDTSEVAYMYNEGGLLEKVREKESGGSFSDVINDFDYAPTGKVSYKLFGNGLFTAYTYDSSKLYRLTNIRTNSGEGGLGFNNSNKSELYKNLSLDYGSFTKLALNTFSGFVLGSQLAQSNEDISAPEETLPEQLPQEDLVVPEKTEEPEIQVSEEVTAPQDTQSAETVEASTTKETSTSTEPVTEPNIPALPEETIQPENIATTTENVQRIPLLPDSEQLKLKAPKEKILGNKEFADGIVKYAYKTDQKVSDISPDSKLVEKVRETGLTLGEEVLSKRTNHARTFATNDPNTFVAEITSGDPQYYQDENGEWWLADYATTTKESYDYQTKEGGGFFERIISFLFQKVSAASATFYPDPHPESSTVDGDVYFYSYNPNTTWDTMHNVSSGNAAYDAQSVVEIYVAKGPSSAIERGFFYFDTSSLGSEAFISSATLSLYTTVMSDEHNDGHDYLAVYHGNLASNDAVVFDDYDECGSVHSPILGSDQLDITDLTNNAYNSWTLDSTGLGWVDPSGITKLCMREGHDAEDIPVSSSGSGNYVSFKSSENSGTSSDPKLIVVYYHLPYAPSDLLTEGLANPASITDTTPEFSAIFNDPDTGDTAEYYRIQVATSSSYWSDPEWDTAKTVISSSTPVGARSPDISYSGIPLTPETTYYWRIKFWNNGGAEGSWSTTTASFSLAAPDSGDIQDIYYVYDNVGNITQIFDYSGTDAAKVVSFGYDDLYRLTMASTTAASSTPYLQTYAYNSIGNITGWRNNSDATTTYSYSNTNYANPHAATSIDGTTLGYDENGNLTTYGSKSYEWDYRNRMASSTEAGLGTTYFYDQNNQRVKKTHGSITTIYPSQYINIENATTTKYIYAGGDLVASIEGTDGSAITTYIHPDHLSSTNVVTDSTGAAVKTLDYYPYGSERISAGDKEESRAFIGQYKDEESNLSYLQNRYLDSDRGQFLSEDPVFVSVSNLNLSVPQDQNSYSYARNNPTNYSDPTGTTVELVDRPIGNMPVLGPVVGYIGAHAFVKITPENPDTLGKVFNSDGNSINTQETFTLGATESGGQLVKDVNGDSGYIKSCNRCASVTISPPEGVSQEEFERRLVEKYNDLPTVLRNKYGTLGNGYLIGGSSNSNNAATTILMGGGIKSSSVDQYQGQMYSQNHLYTPGLGEPVSNTSTLHQQLSSALNQLRSVLNKLQKSLSK